MNDVQYYVEYNARKAAKVIFCVKIKKTFCAMQKAFLSICSRGLEIIVAKVVDKLIK
jgi:hypothetical protein